MASIVCSCGKPVETKPEWAGQWISCPHCKGSLYAPYPGDKPAPPAAGFSEFPQTRLCACCSETIPAADLRCKFCGNDPNVRAPSRPAPAPVVATPVATTSPSDGGMPALVMSLLGYMFCCVLCPIGWMMGSSYEAKCRAEGVEPSGAGRAGKIVGIIGTVILGFNVVFGLLWVLAECL